MTLKVTERDKKLLVVLAVVLIVFGMGFGILLPLVEKGQELSEQLLEETVVKVTNKQKVDTLDALKKQEKTLGEEVSAVRSEFYEVTPSMEIDRMMTGMALAHGLVVKDLDITIPAIGSYTELIGYPEMLLSRIEDSVNEDTASGELTGMAYSGVYTANAKISMTGSREALQAMLDECAALEPKARIAEFLWEQERNDSANYILTMSVELYMSEDADQYLKDSAIQKAVDESTQEQSEEETEDITE